MTPDLCDSWGTHAHAHLTSKSGAPCKQCPEAGQPLPSGRRIPLLLLKMFGLHDVHCNSHILSLGYQRADPQSPLEVRSRPAAPLPELMMLRKASHTHPIPPLPVPRKRGPFSAPSSRPLLAAQELDVWSSPQYFGPLKSPPPAARGSWMSPWGRPEANSPPQCHDLSFSLSVCSSHSALGPQPCSGSLASSPPTFLPTVILPS